MAVTSYGKCPHCGRHGMLVGFWYNGESLTPDYLCPECFKEFDDAMAESEFWTLHERAMDDPDWDAEAALAAFREERGGENLMACENRTRAEFERLYREWADADKVMSAGQFDHPAYRGIVSMGHAVVPYIREKIKAGPDPIVAALGEIMPGVVKTEGYISLTDICKIWGIALERYEPKGA